MLRMHLALEILSTFMFLLYSNLKVIILALTPMIFQKKKDIRGQIVLITGAGSGFGRLLALKFVEFGCKIIACSATEENNSETVRLVKEIGGDIKGYTVDVSDRSAVYKMAEKIKREVGKVDILINNAGIAHNGFILDTPDEIIERIINVNQLGYFWATKAFLPDMIERNFGHLVYVSSVSAIVGPPKSTAYSSSKHGITGLAESLGCELIVQGKDGVNVTVVYPFYSRTEMFKCEYDGLIPMVLAEDVVDAIINGILTNKEAVYVQRFSALINYLKPTSTRKAVISAMKLLVGSELFKTLKVKEIRMAKPN